MSSAAHGYAKEVSFAQPSDLIQPFPAEKPNTWFNTITRYGTSVSFKTWKIICPYDAIAGRSKLANILFTNELQRRLDAEGYDIIVLSLHPGLVITGKCTVPLHP